jgi:sugar phosphate isomerase/epimerase
MKNILIGTMYLADRDCITNLRKLIDLGFESFNLFYWQKFNGVEPEKLAEEVFPIVQAAGVKISAISLFGNPLLDNEEGENTRSDFIRLIDSAKDFGCDIVSGFTGRLIDVPIPENIERFKAVWTPLAERAADKGVRIAWENCHMGGNWLTGDWNIAHNPDAWELMFDALPMDNVGLEWEPCHQLIQLIQPLPQIREWKKRLFHIHGKDATVRWDLISRHGIGGSECFSWHRTPGFGDTNWTDVISELRFVGYEGSIDIEGWHDPVYKNHLEMTGQVHALKYLKECRGGEFIEF